MPFTQEEGETLIWEINRAYRLLLWDNHDERREMMRLMRQMEHYMDRDITDMDSGEKRFRKSGDVLTKKVPSLNRRTKQPYSQGEKDAWMDSNRGRVQHFISRVPQNKKREKPVKSPDPVVEE